MFREEDEFRVQFLSDEDVAGKRLQLFTMRRKKYHGKKYLAEIARSERGFAVMDAFRIISYWNDGYIVFPAIDEELKCLEQDRGFRA